MKAIKKDSTGSILIDTNKGFNVWLDVFEEDGELYADWNKYIFHLDNSNDVEIKEFQDCNDNFDICTSLAISYYENN